jgi:RNA polymerase primary sigma factor
MRRAAEGDRIARDQVIETHLRLVISIARHFHGTRLEFDDLVQEGVIGLISAIEHFNPELGFQFSTYATYWIRMTITRAIDNQARLIRIPVNVAYAALRVERAAHEMAERLGREPTVEEIAEEACVPARKVPRLLATPREPLSLDAAAYAEEEEGAGFQVADPSAVDPEHEVLKGEQRAMLRRLVEDLPERERHVVWERLGFEDGRTRTLREIAEQLRVSREAVRRLELSALRRLRTRLPEHLSPLI